jgi:glutamate decarboxylase
VFRVNYLGGDMPTFTLNFSKAGNQVVGQYYNFLRLGRAGYTHVMQCLAATARWLSDQLESCEHFDVISDGSAIPVVAFRLKDGFGYNEFDISAGLRSYGWQVPAYTMPEGAENVSVLRVVVREGFSADLARSLWEDLNAVLTHMDAIKPDGYFTQEHFSH